MHLVDLDASPSRTLNRREPGGQTGHAHCSTLTSNCATRAGPQSDIIPQTHVYPAEHHWQGVTLYSRSAASFTVHIRHVWCLFNYAMMLSICLSVHLPIASKMCEVTCYVAAPCGEWGLIILTPVHLFLPASRIPRILISPVLLPVLKWSQLWKNYHGQHCICKWLSSEVLCTLCS